MGTGDKGGHMTWHDRFILVFLYWLLEKYLDEPQNRLARKEDDEESTTEIEKFYHDFLSNNGREG